MDENASPSFSQGGQMRAWFLGKDPNSQVDNSPTLFATDRTDRTDRTDLHRARVEGDRPGSAGRHRSVPDHEALIEIPEDVLKFYARRYLEQEGER
jgi:hypothetical protein